MKTWTAELRAMIGTTAGQQERVYAQSVCVCVCACVVMLHVTLV